MSKRRGPLYPWGGDGWWGGRPRRGHADVGYLLVVLLVVLLVLWLAGVLR